MKPLLNLTIVVSALLGVTLSLALVVAYFRNYSSTAGGHPHGTPEKIPSDGQAHDSGGHTSGGHDVKPTSGHVLKHPQEEASHEAAGHHKDTKDTSAKDHTHKTQSTEDKSRPPSIPGPITTSTSPITRPVSVAKSAAISGVPGASHLYHVGANGFFLDQQKIITLTIEQQAALNRIKSKAHVTKSIASRKLQDGECDLWKITAGDHPKPAAIELKVRDIENVRSVQRLSFIRSVGEATQILTDDQRKAIMGTDVSALNIIQGITSEHKHD